jgi:hypothetical protein
LFNHQWTSKAIPQVKTFRPRSKPNFQQQANNLFGYFENPQKSYSEKDFHLIRVSIKGSKP